MRRKITVRFVFGLVELVLAFLVLVWALFLEFDLFGFQLFMDFPVDALSFYVFLFFVFGVILLSGGSFLIYDWWESSEADLL